MIIFLDSALIAGKVGFENGFLCKIDTIPVSKQRTAENKDFSKSNPQSKIFQYSTAAADYGGVQRLHDSGSATCHAVRRTREETPG
jgi:K+-transporting ATPase A subunit